jgi:uncharacterized protein (TIGR02147 family)
MVSIFDFEDTREFLRSYIESLPNKGWGEIQRWAELLGLQASYISQILAGGKFLNVDQALKLAGRFGLKENETDYFLRLVELERCASHETKAYFRKKLRELRSEAKQIAKRVTLEQAFTDAEKSVFYSSWIYSAVRLYCSIGGEPKTLEQIADRFRLERGEAVRILDFLCETGLCLKKRAGYVVGSKQTLLDSSSPFIHRHRQNWRLRALAQLEKTQPEELVFSAPFSISQQDFEALREELAQFLERTFARVKVTDPEEMAILNLDLMKLRV